MGKSISNPYLSDSLFYKEKRFSYRRVDSHLFLEIKDPDILVMPLLLYHISYVGYVVYDSSIS